MGQGTVPCPRASNSPCAGQALRHPEGKGPRGFLTLRLVILSEAQRSRKILSVKTSVFFRSFDSLRSLRRTDPAPVGPSIAWPHVQPASVSNGRTTQWSSLRNTQCCLSCLKAAPLRRCAPALPDAGRAKYEEKREHGTGDRPLSRLRSSHSPFVLALPCYCSPMTKK